jgi:hypothetical protein
LEDWSYLPFWLYSLQSFGVSIEKYHKEIKMKSIFFFTTIFLFFITLLNSCGSPSGSLESDSKVNQFEHRFDSIFLEDLEAHMLVLEYEGCQYLVAKRDQGTKGHGFMAHKGNCTNPIHQCVEQVRNR